MELGIAYGQHRIAQVDIIERQALCFAEPKTCAMEKQEQSAQGVRIELDRALPADIDSAEQSQQLVTGEDVRWCRARLSRFVIGRGKRRPDGVAAADRVAIEPGQCSVLVGPVPGERTVAGKEAQNIRPLNSVAADAPTDMLAERVQQSRAGDEPRAVGLLPSDIGVDRIAENHAKPSRSMSPTSRSVPSRTLAYAEVAETLRIPRPRARERVAPCRGLRAG